MYVYITFHDGLFVDNWISVKKVDLRFLIGNIKELNESLTVC